MIKLLGRPTSINVRKVLWLCSELPLSVVHEPEWGSPDKPANTPQLRALYPNEMAPGLVDGDLCSGSRRRSADTSRCARVVTICSRTSQQRGPGSSSGWTGKPRS